jgi:hypothetical protein
MRISSLESLVGFQFLPKWFLLLPSFYLLKFFLLDFGIMVNLFIYLWLQGNVTANAPLLGPNVCIDIFHFLSVYIISPPKGY